MDEVDSIGSARMDNSGGGGDRWGRDLGWVGRDAGAARPVGCVACCSPTQPACPPSPPAARCSAPCWSSSTSSTASRPPTKSRCGPRAHSLQGCVRAAAAAGHPQARAPAAEAHVDLRHSPHTHFLTPPFSPPPPHPPNPRSSWPPTASTSWTRRCCGRGASTARCGGWGSLGGKPRGGAATGPRRRDHSAQHPPKPPPPPRPQIEFPHPSESSRVDILKIHSRKMNLTRGIDLKKAGGQGGLEG
jgi:hypothetical protein